MKKIIFALTLLLLSACGKSNTLPDVPTQDPNPRYTAIDYKELANYADRYKGQYVDVDGRVFNVLGDYDFQMYLSADTYDAVYVQTTTKLSKIYKETRVTVKGMLYGFYTGKNTSGGDIKQPLILYAKVSPMGQ